jgi:hypothetical protein
MHVIMDESRGLHVDMQVDIGSPSRRPGPQEPGRARATPDAAQPAGRQHHPGTRATFASARSHIRPAADLRVVDNHTEKLL